MIGYQIKVGTTVQPLLFLMVQSSDHISPYTGAAATITVRLSKNGAAGLGPAGGISAVDTTNMPGWYQVLANASDVNTLGPLALHATAAGADPVDCLYAVVAYDPQSVANLGLTALPAVAPAAANGLLTVGTGTGQISPVSGGVDLRTIVGAAVNTSAAQIGVNVVMWKAATIGNMPPDLIFTRSANLQGSPTPTATQVTLDGSASATDNFYRNQVIFFRSGTGAGQSGTIASYAGATKVATLTAALAQAPDATTGYTLEAAGAGQATVSGNVTVGGYAAGQDPGSLVWTDANAPDFATPGTPGYVLKTQLGGAFGATGSVYTAAALVNAPTGTGGGGATPTAIATAVWQDAAAGDFTATGSIGLRLMTNVDAAVSSRSTYAGGPVASVTAPVTVGTVQDKAGYALAPTGLDAIPLAPPTGPASTFSGLLIQLARRFLKKATKDVATHSIKLYADDGTTVIATSAWTDDGAGNESQGAAG